MPPSLALVTVRHRDPSLVSEEGDGKEQRARGSSLCCINVLICFFVFNFQMNNSVAMPRLKYFSVFSKM